MYACIGGKLEKINNDSPEYLLVNDGKLYYSSKALLGSAIKTYSSSNGASVFTNVAGEYLATDGNYLFYAKNSLIDTKGTNGIYKISLTDSNASPVRIVKNKAAYIVSGGDGRLYCYDGSKATKLA